MAFLIDFTLPAGMAEFLGPSDSSLLKMQHSRAPKGLGVKGASRSSVLNRLFREEGEERREQALGGPSNRKSSKVDLGTAVLLQRTGDTGQCHRPLHSLLSGVSGWVFIKHFMTAADVKRTL